VGAWLGRLVARRSGAVGFGAAGAAENACRQSKEHNVSFTEVRTSSPLLLVSTHH
jgi:hypothetical protein